MQQLKDFINADIADEKNYTMSDNVKTEEVVQTDVADKMTGDNVVMRFNLVEVLIFMVIAVQFLTFRSKSKWITV